MSASPCSPAAADCNLLFGVLALQMDFISRDALIQAMNAWVLDKTKPLGQVLFQQQALGAEERSLLEQLVQRHLERHSHDPQRSLAAVACGAAVGQDLRRIVDTELQASLASLPSVPADSYA